MSRSRSCAWVTIDRVAVPSPDATATAWVQEQLTTFAVEIKNTIGATRDGESATVLTPERLGAAAARLAGTPLEPQTQAELAAMVEMAEARAKLAASPVYENDGPRLASARAG